MQADGDHRQRQQQIPRLAHDLLGGQGRRRDGDADAQVDHQRQRDARERTARRAAVVAAELHHRGVGPHGARDVLAELADEHDPPRHPYGQRRT